MQGRTQKLLDYLTNHAITTQSFLFLMCACTESVPTYWSPYRYEKEY